MLPTTDQYNPLNSPARLKPIDNVTLVAWRYSIECYVVLQIVDNVPYQLSEALFLFAVIHGLVSTSSV